MSALIVCGGELQPDFLNTQAEALGQEGQAPMVIACDAGYKYCAAARIRPDFVIGDFDSAGEDSYRAALELGIPARRLNPIKDDTDTQAALDYAFEHTTGDIYLLGATGGRLDHLMGNFGLLGYALKKGRTAYILDERNRVQLIAGDCRLAIQAAGQYGRYVSVMPYGQPATGVTLTGFKYPLTGATLMGFDTLTISNEITATVGYISIKTGYLLVFETRD